MTSKSKRKSNKSDREMRKVASAKKSDRGVRKTMRKGTLYASVSHGALEASAGTGEPGTPGISAEKILRGALEAAAEPVKSGHSWRIRGKDFVRLQNAGNGNAPMESMKLNAQEHVSPEFRP